MQKSLKFSLGLAQIPLMIVLLLLAIAVPLTTKVVQDNADSRNMAAGNQCRNAKGTIVDCSSPTAVVGPGKTTGGGGAAVATPRPTTTYVCTSITKDACVKAGGKHIYVWGVTCHCVYPTPTAKTAPTFTDPLTQYNNCIKQYGNTPEDCSKKYLSGSCNCINGAWVGNCLPSDYIGKFCSKPTAAKPVATTVPQYPSSCKSVCSPNPNTSACLYCISANPKPTVPTNCKATCDANPGSSACMYCIAANTKSKPTVAPTRSPGGGNPVGPTSKPTNKPGNGGNKPAPTCNSSSKAPADICAADRLSVKAQCLGGKWDYDVQLCTAAGREVRCGGSCYVCAKKDGNWVKQTDMTKCPAPTPVVSGDPMILNYQVSFGGVNPNSAQCVVNWPLQFIVMGNGITKTYTNVIPEGKAVIGSELVFSGSLTLTGFTQSSGVAVFIKGPKHIQVKYCKNNQTGPCIQAGGEMTLTANKLTSPVYNFTGYPLVPGDVTGNSTGGQDGWVNGVDFAYVKAKSLIHETVSNGGYLNGDLDGNCQVNSNDVNLLKISLQDKQGQLY